MAVINVEVKVHGVLLALGALYMTVLILRPFVSRVLRRNKGEPSQDPPNPAEEDPPQSPAQPAEGVVSLCVSCLNNNAYMFPVTLFTDTMSAK